MNAREGHNSADARFRSFIDRVLRLKEEQDALAADVREVYAEAKGEGYDKTAMGQLVSHLRRVEKKGRDAVQEASTIFDMYLDAYERASHAHAYAREAEIPAGSHDQRHELVEGPEGGTTDNTVESAPEPGAVASASGSIKPAPTDDELEIPEFLKRSDGYGSRARENA